MKWMILVLVSVAAMPLLAQDGESELAQIQQRWAEIQYQVQDRGKENAFEKLAAGVRG